MDILKTFFRHILLLAFLLPVTVFSQDTGKQILAFGESYTLESKGEFQKAVDVLRTVYDEKSYEINLRLGWLSYLSGAFTESTTYYNRAINIMPYSIEPRFGIVYPLADLGNWDQVILQYNKILSRDPNNTVANYRLGVIYYNREEYNTSHQYLEKVVNLYPFDLDGLLMLGWCKFRLRQYREATVLFQRSLMHTPGNESALKGLSLIN
jgi:tetratricopeptide (TPR) repeat protein